MLPLAAIDWMDAIGRWHPLLLHLPIGLLIALAWLRLWRVATGKAERSLLWLLVLSTWGAGLTGWLLHESAAYPDPVHWHEYLGIALIVLTMGLLWVHRRRPEWYGRALALTVLALLPTAHLGASLTHGPDFLWEPWQKVEALPESQSQSQSQSGPDPGHVPDSDSQDRTVLAASEAERFALVAPLLQERCGRCHGERKRKGGLALHTLAAVQAGGDGGAVLDPQHPEQSELWLRLQLPLDDEDHMPPKNKRQLTEKEIDRLRSWVFSSPTQAADGSQAKGQAKPASQDSSPNETENPDLRQARQALQQAGVVVAALAQKDGRLLLSWDGAEELDAKQRTAVQVLGERVVEVRFAGRPVSGDWLAQLSALPHLQVLDLSRAQLQHPDLRDLKPKPQWRELRFAHTPLSAEALDVLHSLSKATTVILSGTGLTQADDPGRPWPNHWTHGIRPTSAQLEEEPPVVFQEYAASPAEDAALALQPINATCPVTGRPIDPAYRLIHDERVVGFCCADCLNQFVAAPEEYAGALPD